MISLTDQAAVEMKRILDEQGVAEAAIRVFVQGACGCGSAQYGMGVEDEIASEDSIVDACGVKFVIDPESAPYLEGAEIDYKDGLMGRGFTIVNPNQVSSGCGCGHGH
jgi:iron-sulfur cluster assembly accessory protein